MSGRCFLKKQAGISFCRRHSSTQGVQPSVQFAGLLGHSRSTQLQKLILSQADVIAVFSSPITTTSSDLPSLPFSSAIFSLKYTGK